MKSKIGQIEAIFRYPIKSMAGQPLEVAQLGWHGIEGDRRLALRRLNDRSGFPWLTASKLPALLLFSPQGQADADGNLPTQVRTPEGHELPISGEALAAELGCRYGAPLELMHFKHGIFDDASVSVIATDTFSEISRLAGVSPDSRRFRPNIVIRSVQSVPFLEDQWVGGVLSFGEDNAAPAVDVTMRDLRCSVVNYDPDSARCAPKVMQAIVRANNNNAGVYGTVTQIGELRVGQSVFFQSKIR
jgi:uncharacterized protein YcbX